jgi:hypothetical protein
MRDFVLLCNKARSCSSSGHQHIFSQKRFNYVLLSFMVSKPTPPRENLIKTLFRRISQRKGIRRRTSLRFGLAGAGLGIALPPFCPGLSLMEVTQTSLFPQAKFLWDRWRWCFARVFEREVVVSS